jgi:ABC-type branched-subunit amino acid transport system substrate-binding protein
MISAQSLLPRSSGSKIKTALLLLLLCAVSCSASRKTVTTSLSNTIRPGYDTDNSSGKDDTERKKELFQKKIAAAPEFENDFHIALLLPLYLEKESVQDSPDDRFRMSVLDYYQGLLLAFDSLKKEGIHAHLHVYDTRKDSLTTVKVVKELENIKPDLIIGPLDRSSFGVVSAFSIRYKIPLVAPFALPEEHVLPVNPYAFFCNPSLRSYGRRLARYFSAGLQPLNIIYLSDSSETDRSFYTGFSALMRQEKIPYKKLRISGDISLKEHLILRDSTRNVFVIPTDNEQKASQALKALKSAEDGKARISIVGLDSWEDFRAPDYSQWNRMRLLLLSNYFASSDSSYKRFFSLYRERFTVLPNNLSLRGFDQGLFFGKCLLAFGRSFPKYVQNTEFGLTHNSFFWNYSGNVVENEAVNLLEFDEFRFIRTD